MKIRSRGECLGKSAKETKVNTVTHLSNNIQMFLLYSAITASAALENREKFHHVTNLTVMTKVFRFDCETVQHFNTFEATIKYVN